MTNIYLEYIEFEMVNYHVNYHLIYYNLLDFLNAIN